MSPANQSDLDAFRDCEHAGWQRLAGGYDRYFQGLVAQAIDPLLDAAAVAAGGRVLDLCCGPGYVAARARLRGASPVGIDFSAEMIALAERRHPDLEFREGDAEDLDLPDGGFDAVVMNFGVLHLARPERAVAEAARVLCPGGRLAFTVWARPGDNVGHRIILGAIEAHGRLDVPLPEGPPMFRFSDPEECRRLMTAGGLVHPVVRTLPLAWELPAPDGVFDAYRAGGVRPSMLLEAQTPRALEEIRNAVRLASAPYERDGRLRIPMACVLASATK